MRIRSAVDGRRLGRPEPESETETETGADTTSLSTSRMVPRGAPAVSVLSADDRDGDAADAAGDDGDGDDGDGEDDDDANDAGAGDDDDDASNMLRALRSDSGGRCSRRFSTTADRMSNMLTDTPDGVSIGDGSGPAEAMEDDDRALFSRRDTTVRLGLARTAVGAALAVECAVSVDATLLSTGASAGSGDGVAVTVAAPLLAAVSVVEEVDAAAVAVTVAAAAGAGADGSRSALVMPILI
jgi:hypothetical protein